MKEKPICQNCKSEPILYGMVKEKQRYYCKKCRRTFTNPTIERKNAYTITEIDDIFEKYRKSLRTVKEIAKEFGVAPSTIYRWIADYQSTSPLRKANKFTKIHDSKKEIDSIIDDFNEVFPSLELNFPIKKFQFRILPSKIILFVIPRKGARRMIANKRIWVMSIEITDKSYLFICNKLPGIDSKYRDYLSKSFLEKLINKEIKNYICEMLDWKRSIKEKKAKEDSNP